MLRLKRKITIGETIGNDFNLIHGETVIPFTYSRTLLAVEDVTTAAGEFKDCLKFSRVLNGETSYEWLAPNVGIVKSTGAEEYEVASYDLGDNNNCYCPPPQNSTFDMQSFILHIPALEIEGNKYELDLELKLPEAVFVIKGVSEIDD